MGRGEVEKLNKSVNVSKMKESKEKHGKEVKRENESERQKVKRVDFYL